MRVTVKIRTASDTADRDFHLDETKAANFAAKVIAAGGTATITPFAMSADLVAMLRKAGVDTSAIA